MNTSLQTKKEVNSVNMRLQTKNVFWKKYQDDAERCYIILEFSSKKGISPPKCYSTESYIQWSRCLDLESISINRTLHIPIEFMSYLPQESVERTSMREPTYIPVHTMWCMAIGINILMCEADNLLRPSTVK
jgi:hypothetical protein